MTKFREDRGQYEDSMNTVIEVADFDALVTHFNSLLNPWRFTVRKKDVKLRSYGVDERNGWDTYIVTIEDYGVIGFTNGVPVGYQ